MKVNYLEFKKGKVDKYKYVTNINIDTLTDTGFYYVDGTCTGTPLNSMSFYLTVISHSSNKYAIQYATVVSNSSFRNFQRRMYNGEWEGWTELGMPVQQNTLKNIDLNTLTVPGIYEHDGHANQNNPLNFGVFEVIDCGYYIMQRVTDQSNMGVRLSYNNGANWSPWRYITFKESI